MQVLDKAQVAALMNDVGFVEAEDVNLFTEKWSSCAGGSRVPDQRIVIAAVLTRRLPRFDPCCRQFAAVDGNPRVAAGAARLDASHGDGGVGPAVAVDAAEAELRALFDLFDVAGERRPVRQQRDVDASERAPRVDAYRRHRTSGRRRSRTRRGAFGRHRRRREPRDDDFAARASIAGPLTGHAWIFQLSRCTGTGAVHLPSTNRRPRCRESRRRCGRGRRRLGRRR